LEVENKAMWS